MYTMHGPMPRDQITKTLTTNSSVSRERRTRDDSGRNKCQSQGISSNRLRSRDQREGETSQGVVVMRSDLGLWLKQQGN